MPSNGEVDDGLGDISGFDMNGNDMKRKVRIPGVGASRITR
jgi:hypothetical protein